jgi:D-3-phosphoglycerate dehydrogenase
MIGAEQLALMPPGALLVNVSRGGLVDTDAVIAALDGGHLGGAAFDALESEPRVPKALLAHPDVVITPHVAFSSDAAVLELRRRAAEEVVRVLSGRPPAHPCNAPVSARPNGVVR